MSWAQILSFCVVLGAAAAPAAECNGQTDTLKHFMFVSYYGRSHVMPYLNILAPLSQKGHKVTIVTDSTVGPWLKALFPRFHLTLVPDVFREHMLRIVPVLWPKMINPKSTSPLAEVFKEMTIPTYRSSVEFLRGVFDGDRPDLLLCDFMLTACPDLAQTLNIRYVVTMSGLPPGVSSAPYIVDWNTQYLAATTESLSLWQRFIINFVTPVKLLRALAAPLKQLKEMRQELGLTVVEGPPDVQHAKALKLINTFLGFETARPTDPTVQLIGPVQHHLNVTLPADIAHWLANLADISPQACHHLSSGTSNNTRRQDKDGTCRVVYVAFGTVVDLPDQVLHALYSALVAALDAGGVDGVIWAISGTRSDRFPVDMDNRVLLLPFAPQKAVLAHPSVHLFISHGGAESSHECIFEGKPMLIIPFYGDQPLNAVKLKTAGMAEFVPHHQVTAPKIQALLHLMLHSQNSTMYQAAAARMRALARTLAKHNTATAASLLEYYAEHGWGHLIPASTRMSWMKATNVDLWVVSVVGVFVTLAVSSALLVNSARSVAACMLQSTERRSQTAPGAAAIYGTVPTGKKTS